MADLSQLNPTKRFTGLEDLYALYRPTYPAEAIDFIIRRCGLDATTTLVDVGCGTGISTRLFAARGIPVIGVDPNDAMRCKAEAAATPAGGRTAEYRKGSGEATGLPDGCAAAVVAAQAFHWLDAAAAFREFCRILRPGGHAVLMWNERDESDPFTAAYGAAVRATPGAAAVEGPRARAGEALLHSPLFADASLTTFTNIQDVDEEGLIGRAFSASYAPREPATVAAFTAALRKVFADYQRDGRAALRYVTSVYLGKRK
jgi:SAM-dependent methyltransferase